MPLAHFPLDLDKDLDAAQLPGEYRREVDEFVQGEYVGKLAEHQQIHLRGVGELPGLDFLFGRELLDFVPRQIAIAW